jgi:hypothetical protein
LHYTVKTKAEQTLLLTFCLIILWPRQACLTPDLPYLLKWGIIIDALA